VELRRLKLSPRQPITCVMSSQPSPQAPAKPRMLCVDDDPQVLEGLRDTLRRSFDVRVATSALEGLRQLKQEPAAYAIVLSDMRMPIMDGASFLSEACRLAPDATRMLLTGFADIDAAMRAVNGAQLFRFLTKPCEPQELMRACTAALGQHRLVTAERVLLEQTLHGSVQALAGVLALANPAAFGRARRVQATVTRLAEAIGMQEPWEVEVAALLAPIGAVTLPAATAEKLYARAPLTPHEAAMVDRIPAITRRILRNIPRLEGVMEVLDNYARDFSATTADAIVPIGARMLRIARDYDALEAQAIHAGFALSTMRSRDGTYDPHLLDALTEITAAAGAAAGVREIEVDELRTGMTLAGDVRSAAGQLLIARDEESTDELVELVRNLADGDLHEPLVILDHRAGV
jgi:response regulator RpfG family c-di-GMP phosphodiesterase